VFRLLCSVRFFIVFALRPSPFALRPRPSPFVLSSFFKKMLYLVFNIHRQLDTEHMEPVFTNDAITFGLLMIALALVFKTAGSPSKRWKNFYTYVPPLLVCYFLPALLHWPLGLIAYEWYDNDLLDWLRQRNLSLDAGATLSEVKAFLEANGISESEVAQFKRNSRLYFVASRYLLPASLILFTLSIDFKGVLNLGPKALIMFFTATMGIVLGGPVALLVLTYLFPSIVNLSPDELWRGLSTIAGSWIGGGANQTAMKEIFDVPGNIFGSMIVVDVVVANIWMGFLLFGAGVSDRVDRWLKADSSAIEDLKEKVETYRASVERMPTTKDMFLLLGVGFGGVALSHLGSDLILPLMEKNEVALKAARLNSLLSGFFWLVVWATTLGLIASFIKPLRRLEGVGASRWGSVFIYILVATIGMQMDLGEVAKNLGLFAIGIIWMLVHIGLLLLVAKLIRAPFFFVAVGSQANVGGAASAPIVASAFSTALAPVGVLMAVLGYALGTYMALVCAYLMQWIVV
jgi:uncharacterized membrane protein